MIPKYLCPYCNKYLANIYDLISHAKIEHDEELLKPDQPIVFMNPSRRDSIDITKLRERYGNRE